MAETIKSENESARDVTRDFLLCNRCGSCRYVCPLVGVLREEWAGARGKVELAEAFFRGEKIDERELRKIFDLCLHCMACEENCPSGVRADEIVMAARAEMARRGFLPRAKRIALHLLEGADTGLFRLMRSLGLVRRSPLHGVGGKSPLAFLFPLLGWPRERFVPLPSAKPFLSSGRELFRAADVAISGWSETSLLRPGSSRLIHSSRAEDLAGRVEAARIRNLAAGAKVYFFVGHAVNNIFPEEARAVVRLLNILGFDVLAPRDQLCCGAPVYYAGDIEGARDAAMRVLESLEGKTYDLIVSTCSSGSLMLKSEFPRLFDLNDDGYFEIAYDRETETFKREPRPSDARKRYSRAEDIYRRYVEGKVRDINELIAETLELRSEETRPPRGIESEAEELHTAAPKTAAREEDLPIVTYHHPCHLNRGQNVDWQPEAILDALPGYRYVRMKDADRCCGGGGAFTFQSAGASAEIARAKMDAVAAVNPAVVATACPLCRIQLMDMIRRRFVVEAKKRGETPLEIPVRTPAELLLEDLDTLLLAGREAERPKPGAAR